MKIGPDTVRHVARLAELAVTEREVADLALKLESIVAFVEQLEEVPSVGAAAPLVVGPQTLRLRQDVVDPVPLVHQPDSFAPDFKHGFFLVPKLGGLAEE